jgi:predicted nucleic acid-binding Zn ribbon protein
MFKRDVQTLKTLILRNLRAQGLETPLLQKRLVDAWPIVAGEAVARYTREAFIQNQTLVVRLTIPALRTELSMRRTELVKKLNDHVGEQVITEIRFS